MSINTESNENIIKLRSHLRKEDYLRLLKEKTYEYNLTNTYAANSFLSKIQDDQIFIYYTGRHSGFGGFKGFEAYIRECGGSSILERRFVPAGHVKLLWYSFLIVMWIGMLWFMIQAPYMGIIIIPLGIIITMILYMIVTKSDETDNEERIVDFLVNLHIK
ncbi:MAG: hypothetical protein J6K58_13295 [Lachnospiraceae bacterium]|nr:hypothetical protein [Lachnospiraceae bacterium]